MKLNEVYLVKGYRTPQVKAGDALKDIQAPYLGHYLVRHIMDELNLPKDSIDEVIFGNTGTPAKYPNVGRVIALEAGLHKKTSGYTVHRNCASGLEAMSQAYDKIASGRNDLIFAGGVESMSNMPLIFSKKMTNLFMKLMKAKTPLQKIQVLKEFRPDYLKPIIAIEQGLTDPFCGLNMGQTAEKLASELNIDRLAQDEFANESHRKAVFSQKEHLFDDEILPIIYGTKQDKLLSHDIGPRESSTMDKLAKLRPFFDRKNGTVTVGNACPITDGGSVWLLASKEAIDRYQLDPMARVVDYYFHGLEPERMGLGPVLATHGVLKRTGLSLDQIALIELNEAFAAQVMACQAVAKSDSLSQKFGMDKAIGEIANEKLNIRGGAIALGHPVGSTGSRLVVTLAHSLMKEKKKYGLATLCIGGGQGGAMIIENLKM